MRLARALLSTTLFFAAASGGLGQAPYADPRSTAFSESSDEISNMVGELDERRSGTDEFDPFGFIFDSWDDSWRWVDEELGLNVGFAYTALYQAATDGETDKSLSGGAGDFDIFGTWYLLNHKSKRGLINEGVFGFNFESRHVFDGTPPSELGNAIGSLWGTTSGFDEQEFSLIQFWWQQRLFDNSLVIRAGKLDMASIFDVYRFNSSNHYYQNAAFSDNPAIPFPGNGIGAAIAWHPNDHWFLRAGYGDAEGRKTENINTGNVDAWFSASTLGWTGGVGELGTGLYQVTGWHSDHRKGSEKPTATGFSILAQQELGNGWVPYTRYAWSSDTAVDVESLITAGAVREGAGRRENDRLGLAVGWGRPHESGLRDQWAGELFYRCEITPELRITPSVQIIVNPSRNRNDDVIGVFGVRGRFSF